MDHWTAEFFTGPFLVRRWIDGEGKRHESQTLQGSVSVEEHDFWTAIMLTNHRARIGAIATGALRDDPPAP